MKYTHLVEQFRVFEHGSRNLGERKFFEQTEIFKTVALIEIFGCLDQIVIELRGIRHAQENAIQTEDEIIDKIKKANWTSEKEDFALLSEDVSRFQDDRERAWKEIEELKAEIKALRAGHQITEAQLEGQRCTIQDHDKKIKRLEGEAKLWRKIKGK